VQSSFLKALNFLPFNIKPLRTRRALTLSSSFLKNKSSTYVFAQKCLNFKHAKKIYAIKFIKIFSSTWSNIWYPNTGAYTDTGINLKEEPDSVTVSEGQQPFCNFVSHFVTLNFFIVLGPISHPFCCLNRLSGEGQKNKGIHCFFRSKSDVKFS
jgi:hypothetical protein